jgi:pyruvate,orthophosphate dikinase
MIGEWASLAPQLFLPMGARTLHRSLLRGIARAAGDGRSALTVVLGGATDRSEIDALADVARSVGVPGVGVCVQNMCALMHIRDFSHAGYVVWIDIMEVTRSFFGFPSALSLADEVFERYVSDGMMGLNPRMHVAPELLRTIETAIAGANGVTRVGVECGEGAAPSLVADLRKVGLSVFSLTPSRSATVRLALGQTMSRREDDESAVR